MAYRLMFRALPNAMSKASADTLTLPAAASLAPEGLDLAEWYLTQPWSDGLPVVAPTPEKVAAIVYALVGTAEKVECRIPPRWGDLSRQTLAINLVMAGCLAEYAPVVR